MNKTIYKPVPVLMYHSVGITDKKWIWNHLTCPWELFEDQLKTLKRDGYKSISLLQLYDYIFHSKPVPEKSIVFTFDDGYLDNWVFAYPLMKKYGFQGTIYVNPEFVDIEGGKRKRFDETDDIDSLQTSGFLTWDEMKEMESEGIMFIESHALTHTWYPKSDKIIDYRHPGDNYIWMTWNNHPALKYKLQFDDENLINWGEPVYEYEKSLSCKRFFPDERLKLHICDFVKNNGGESFFNKNGWKNILNEEVKNYRSSHTSDERYETDHDYHKRILYELTTTKSIIETKLNKEVLFHCWPGGSATKIGMEISDKIGFKLSNAANDILDIRYKIKNNNLYQINRLNRFAPIAFLTFKENSKPFIKYVNGKIFLIQLKEFKSNKPERLFYKIVLLAIKKYYHIIYLFKS